MMQRAMGQRCSQLLVFDADRACAAAVDYNSLPASLCIPPACG